MTKPVLRYRLRRLLLAFATGALVLLGGRAVQNGVADHYAISNPARALAWRSDHPEALYRQALRLADQPAQAEAAADHARRALRANPLDGRSYRILGTLADAAGDREQAARLFKVAAQRTPRDLASQAWLLDYHLAEGELPAAMQNLDLLLRVNPGLFPNMEAQLLGLASAAPAHAALAERLASAPPWRGRLLAAVAAKAPDADAVAPLFDRLRRAPGGLAPAELSAWVDRLGREGRWGQAYLVWVSQLPPDKLGGLGNVFNGGFEWEPGQGGFDWRFGRIAGARIDRLPTEGASDRLALRVAFEDRRVPFAHVRQLLALAPGRYTFSARAKPDTLRTERGLVWTLTCATGGPALGETPPLSGNGPWRELQADFEVPPQNCAAQWLTLRLPARIPAEQRIGGRAWFDTLKISRHPPK
ncbi:tetratricopeptide repeat protein [Arenimonas alkanexedens]